MVRAAAKNHPTVAIVTSPAAYDDVLAAVAAGGFTLAERQRLAAEAFVHTATYDVARRVVDGQRAHRQLARAPASRPGWAPRGTRRRCCATARTRTSAPRSTATAPAGRPGLAQAEQLHGKEMSYNNYVDADAARRAAYDFDEPAVAIIKHANPCGIAVGADVADAHRKAHECDPVTAFGGVIATNVPVSVAMAEQVAEIFTEVVVAPGYEDGAVEVLPGQEEHPDPRVPAARPRGGVEMRPISRRAAAAAPRRVDADGRRPVHLDPRHRRGRLRRRSSPTSPSRGAPAAR